MFGQEANELSISVRSLAELMEYLMHKVRILRALYHKLLPQGLISQDPIHHRCICRWWMGTAPDTLQVWGYGMDRLPRQQYTKEFREQAVHLVIEQERTTSQARLQLSQRSREVQASTPRHYLWGCSDSTG